ncbi:MAG: hypothetical protein GF418_15940 [Chitinivibrionales bacterium]|nr:hypothetical protein [Chitinivibrionales bacterium]
MMMKANTVGMHDGEMAYWVNDSLIHHVDTMMWRTSPTLAMNRVRVQHYITTSDAEGFSNRVWFDDVVVSTQRIGSGEGNTVLDRGSRRHRRLQGIGEAGPAEVSFYSATGRFLLTSVAHSSKDLKRAPLPAGAFVVKATSSEGRSCFCTLLSYKQAQ